MNGPLHERKPAAAIRNPLYRRSLRGAFEAIASLMLPIVEKNPPRSESYHGAIS